jgi:hypothetical protein
MMHTLYKPLKDYSSSTSGPFIHYRNASTGESGGINNVYSPSMDLQGGYPSSTQYLNISTHKPQIFKKQSYLFSQSSTNLSVIGGSIIGGSGGAHTTNQHHASSTASESGHHAHKNGSLINRKSSSILKKSAA